MHQLDTLSNLLHEYCGERSRLGRTDQRSRMSEVDFITVPLVLTLAIGAAAVFLFKGLTSQK
ncbi:inorganic pyrophosphatase TTM1 [Senna tora]|uniref:Inorganic pyrophosphatase TTM1 n=1 Tax=Senna tora TaxID=362788 RepID=A0A834SM29_9FABA|nr:inorganic pyrophosphatase TTM1 [Senna tora]